MACKGSEQYRINRREGSWDTVQEAWQKDMVLHSMDTYEFAMRTMDYYRLAQLHAETVYIERGLSTDILSNHRFAEGIWGSV